MCNGYRHPEDCDCGFGPPYLGPTQHLSRSKVKQSIGVIRERKRENWASKGVVDRNKIESGLGQLGLKPRWLKAILKKYSAAGYPRDEEEWRKLSRGQKQSAAKK